MSENFLDIEAILDVESDPDRLRREVERFVAAGGAEGDLLAALNAAYDRFEFRLTECVCHPAAAPLMDRITDLAECRIPVAATTAAYGDFDRMRAFVIKGADLFLPTSRGSAVSAVASWAVKTNVKPGDHRCEQAVEVLRFLLTRVHPEDFERERIDRTALATAARGANPEMIRLLLEAGSDPNRLDESGWTPLHWLMSTMAGKHAFTATTDFQLLKAARVLLEHGADPNARSCTGQTPLHLLAAAEWEGVTRRRMRQLVELLLDCGADLDALNNDGMTPLALALETVPTLSDSAGRVMRLAAQRCIDRMEIFCAVMIELGASVKGRLSNGSLVEHKLPPAALRMLNARRMAQHLGAAMGGCEDLMDQRIWGAEDIDALIL